MTLSLNLTPAEEARLTAAARQAGVAPERFLKMFVDSLPLNRATAPPKVKPQSKSKQVSHQQPSLLRGLGMFAHASGGSEQYAEEKQVQIAWEERSQA